MIRNNLKIAWRSLLRYRLYSLVNILGLGFGMACFLLISLYALDELTFDGIHKKGDQIYRVIQHRESDLGELETFGAVAYGASTVAKEEIPGVENSTKLLMWGRAVIRNPENENAFYQPFITADNAFFEIFDFPFVTGNRTNALVEPNSVVLSQELAQKLFGDVDPLGRITYSDRGMDLKVTGIMQDMPTNSHLQFEMLVSHSTIEAQTWFDDSVREDWGGQNFGTYLMLEPKANPAAIAKQLTAFAETRDKEDRPFKGAYALQELKDVHFGSTDFRRELNESKSSYTFLYIFCSIGLFIISIACINYINLSTARASTYNKEVGVRKVIGANNQQLFSRFMSESAVLTLAAFIVGFALAQFALPWFNEFTEKQISLFPSESNWLFIVILCNIILVSLAAGGYPSVYLSRLRPKAVLQGGTKNTSGQRSWLRQGLVVLQFSLSIIMIVGTLIAWQQMDFIQNKDLGFSEEQLIVVDINSGKVRNGFETIRNGYGQLPNVESVSVSSRVPGEWKNLLQAEIRPAENAGTVGPRPWFMGVDENFIETFDLELLSGRNFDPTRFSDSSAVIMNQQAAALLGITEADNQEIFIMSRINNGAVRELPTPFRARIIGIVKDFNFQSLYEPVGPLVLAHRNNPIQSIDYFTARISGQNVERTIAQMTDVLHAVDPEHVFEYHFLDQQIASFYEADASRSFLFSVAACCAIFIACLGLFGLAAFTAERRAKEIGIRKVLGASTSSIVGLLSGQFLKLVALALIIATPIAYVLAENWLQDFAYRIDVQWWVFLLAGVAAIAIAFLTVSFQSLKAAISNPINSLKDE